MADQTAARRYAQAAFDIAVESGNLATWRSNLDDVATVLSESAAADLFADSRVPLERRLALLERTLDIPTLALNLAKLLVSKGRSREARAIAEAFNRLADEREGILHAEVITAVALAPGQLASIEQRISASTGKRVQTVTRVDPAIIGGLVVRIGDRLIDGSVRTRLKQLRLELEGVR